MRGSIVFAIGVVMMAVALTAVVATVVMVNRQEDGPVVAQEPIVAPTPAPEKASSPDPVEDPRDKMLDIPKQESIETPSRVAAERKKTQRLPVTGALPEADTTSKVAVKTCSGGTFKLNTAEKQMFDLHNRERSKRGIRPLCISSDLMQVARARSQDMLSRGYFSHYTPEGASITDQVKREGYDSYLAWVGENISRGGGGTDTDTPRSRFQAFMDSPGHRANVLRENFDEVGVGAVSGKYQAYADTSTIYTVVFGDRL